MSIPILNDLNKELTRLCVAGSLLGKEDPRIKKYIPILNKMGEKATVFKALASKLEVIVDGDENASENLAEALTILYSILYTQGSTNTDDYSEQINFSNKKTKIQKLPYSKIKLIENLVKNKPNGEEKEFKEIYELNLHDDIRLYDLYCDCISERHTPISDYLEEILIPSIGEDIVPYIERRLDIKGSKKDARLFRVLYKVKKKAYFLYRLKSLKRVLKT